MKVAHWVGKTTKMGCLFHDFRNTTICMSSK